jgi:hypothetical protein
MRTLLIHTNRIQALVAGLLLAVPLSSQVPPSGLNPAVQRVVSEVSKQRIAEIMRKLESFGTRHVMSAKDDPQQGIAAAARWISSEFQGYSPRLEVRSQPFTVKRAGAYAADAELSNVIAVLPGTTQRDRFVIVSAHYDSLNLARRAGPSDAERLSGLLRGGMEEAEARRFMQLFPTAEALGDVDAEATAAQKLAPGVADDASGTAAVMELARVMSRYTWRRLRRTAHESKPFLITTSLALKYPAMVWPRTTWCESSQKDPRILQAHCCATARKSLSGTFLPCASRWCFVWIVFPAAATT